MVRHSSAPASPAPVPNGSRKPEAFTKPFCDFLTTSPTVFHAVDQLSGLLRDHGFEHLLASELWAGRIQPGGRYYFTRNNSSLIAFAVGPAYRPGNGFALVASHLDVLAARLRPVSTRPSRAGYLQLGVAPYAGALNQTWWDRDLALGGRVVLRVPGSGATRTALVKTDWPVARIPTLAPHFGQPIMGSNNMETDLVPIIGLDTNESTPLSAPLARIDLSRTSDEDSGTCDRSPVSQSFVHSQPPGLVRLVASQLGLGSAELDTIVNWDLELYDAQPAQTGGIDRDMIFAGRLDDRLCSWAAVMGLLAADSSADDCSLVHLVALFDNEEIGSLLRQGARSDLLPSVIERIVEASCASPSPTPTPATATAAFGPGLMGQTYAHSFLISADVTHAVNPNFLHCYLDGHQPRLNTGIVLKTDANGHMTTDACSSDMVTRITELAGLPAPQHFQVRNDFRSGSTVGPMLSSALGVRAADVGLPQLSMHSIRATTGALDPGLGAGFFAAFFNHWHQIDQEWR